MKRNVTLALTGRAVIGCLILFGLLLAARESAAASGGFNPYSAIVERNSFGLKPAPNPADLVKPPPPPVSADIKLQGIATILGRNQVLMKVKLPARPPEPAREQALVLSEGQRDGEVEVLEINPAEGSVKVKNGSEVLALNMRDHGEKPTPGAAAPAGPTGALPPVNLPGVPRPAPPAGAQLGNRAESSGVSVSTFGGGGGASQNVSAFGNTTTTPGTAGQKTLPSRTLRSTPSQGSSNPQGAGEFQNVSPEAQAILIEAQRTQIAPGGFDPLPKTAITPTEQMRPQPQ